MPWDQALTRKLQVRDAHAWGSLPLLLAACQQALRTLNALTEAVLKHAVTLAFLDVSRDCQTDYLRNRLTIDGRDCV